MLLGESGLGKGFPVNRAKLLVMNAKVTRVIAGRSSIQAIVTELATAKKLENEDLITDSRGYVVNGELSTAIISDPDSLTILTDLFDGHYNPEWTNLLKGTGAEKLKDPYITALFGSSPAHFYDSIPQANIEGGYIGRNLIIYEEKRSKDVDLLDNDERDETDKFNDYLIPRYIPHLQKIASLKGQIVPSPKARELFNEWRSQWRKKQAPDKTGFMNRVPDHVLKVSMCLSLSHYDFDGYITEPDLEVAINQVTHLVYANKRTVEGQGIEPLAKVSKLVIDYLLAAEDNKLTRRHLLRRGYGNFNSFTLDQILGNLEEMQWIKKEKVGVGKNQDLMIKLAGQPLEEYQKFLRKGANNGR